MSFLEKGKPFEDLIEAGIEEVKSNLYAVVNAAERIPLGLTGGKDSRLSLAFCDAFGLTDYVDSFTNGHPQHPDVLVAKEISKIYQLNHRSNVPQYTDSSIPYVDADELFHRMAVHVFRTDASFGVWDLKSRGKSGYGVQLSGFLGEVLKNYLKKPKTLTYNFLPSDFIKKHGVFDPLGIIDKSLIEEVDKKLKDKLEVFTKLGYEFDDIPDLYYATIRLPQWLGAARLVDGYSTQSVFIINSPSLSQLAMNLPEKERRLNIIHYELMKRLSPKLLTIPFAMQTWDKELVKYGATPEIINKPITSNGSIPSNGSWQFLLNENPFFRKLIISLINDNASSKLWDFVNKGKLLNLLEGNKVFTHSELISIYGLITVFFKECDFVLPSKLGHHQSDNYHKSTLIKSTNTKQLYYLKSDTLEKVNLNEELGSTSFVFVNEKCLNIIFNDESEFPIKSTSKKQISIISRLKKFFRLKETYNNSISFNGYLKVKNNKEVSGWICCNEYPYAKLTLDICRNNKLVTQITANLKYTGIGNKGHAFKYLFKEPVESEDITVKVSGSKYQLQLNNANTV